MTNYHAVLGHFQPPKSEFLTASLNWIANLLQDARQRLITRHTRNVLTSLDRQTLEDIGVPHEHMSTRAGELERYPEIIRPRR